MKLLTAAGMVIMGANGSYYVFFKAPNNLTDLEFTNRALEKNVLIVPGRAFSSRHGYVRVSYGTSFNQVKIGIERLVEIIDMFK